VPENVITTIKVRSGEIKIYSSQRLHDLLLAFMRRLKFEEAVQLGQLLEAYYTQGKKDGARAAFEAVDEGLVQARRLIRHRLPGRPKKRR
jgi:hypothetical protein